MRQGSGRVDHVGENAVARRCVCAANMVRMKVRFARHTDRLEEIVRFYRDGVGLRVLGGFRDHAGYDGVFLDLPGTGAHLEFTTGGGHSAPMPDAETILVLYFDDELERQRIAARLAGREVSPSNPYWRTNALAFADPDGFHVLLAMEK